MATYAGRYSEDLQDRYGNGYRNALVAVQTLAAAPVTLYADRTKTAYVPASGLAANEIKADSRGNLIFFADPGNYQIVVTPVGGSTLAAFPVSVLPDPLEPDASEGALANEEAARIAGDDAIQDDLTAHEADTANPHAVTKAQVGLSDVDNTSDANKPVSTAQQAALTAVDTAALHKATDEAVTGVKDFTEPFRLGRFTRAALLAKSALQGAVATVTDTVRGVWMRGELAWWRINGSTLNVREFGAIGDNTQHPLSEFFATLGDAQAVYPTATALTDNIDGVAIQKAIDAAEAAKVGDVSFYLIDLGTGQYRLNTPIDWKSAGIVGTVRNSGTRIYWDGAAGAPHVIRQNTQKSFNKFRNIAFYPGANQPESWLDATGASLDVGFDTSYLHFGRCLGDAIKASGWINYHPHSFRFDGPGGYAIRFTPGSGQNMSSFSLDNFTLDNNRGGAGGSKGMVLVDNTANASNLGAFTVRNGRIEINTLPDPDWAIVRLKLSDVGLPARSLALEVSSVTYADAAGAVGDCVLYRETANTTGSEKLILNNFQASNMSQVLGGTWPSDFPRPTIGSAGVEHMGISGGNLEYVATAFLMRPRSVSASIPIAIQRGTDTTNRWQMDDLGKQSWGPGFSGAVDTELSRVAANVLGVGADDCLRTGRAVTGSRPAAATVGQGAQFFDTTLNKPIWSTGSGWVDASGAAV